MSEAKRLDSQSIIELCGKLGFDSSQYRLNYGSALVMHGVKEFAHDIDMDAAWELFGELTMKYPLRDARSGDKYICIDDIVDIFPADDIATELVYISGIPVAGLKLIMESKRKLGREKDLEDIRLIEKHLAEKENEEAK